jgi:uncharacterized membrane protein YraQ (UPF0718 family)
MSIFSRSNGSELPSESQVEYPNRTGRRWPVLVAYVIAALLVATAVVFIGRWVYHQVSNSDDSKNVSTRQGIKSTNPSQQAPAQSAAPKNPSGNGTATPPSKSGSPASPSPGNLPNNGPGEVIALFIGSSAIAATLHYAVTTRRLER